MEKILYFEINSGISGDMTIASLLDLGLDQDKFLSELDKLGLEGYSIKISKVKKNGIKATDFKVILENNDSDDQHHKKAKGHHHKNKGHGHHHGNHEHKHQTEDHNNKDHQKNKNNQSSTNENHHRNLNDIQNLIEQSSLNDEVKKLSIDIFKELAAAEAKVHDKEIDEVHFHEVGAVDSIVDIVGAAILINMLDYDHIYASPLSLGRGFTKAAHGIIPVPAPATIEILKGVPVYSSGVKSELVTPTGAAIIKTIAEDFIELPEVEIEKIAYGAGKKDLESTNVLRLYQAKKKVKKNY